MAGNIDKNDYEVKVKELVTKLKYKIAIKKGKKWVVVEEHPLNYDAEVAFGKYGNPSEFSKNCGCVGKKDAIPPYSMVPGKDVFFYDD